MVNQDSPLERLRNSVDKMQQEIEQSSYLYKKILEILREDDGVNYLILTYKGSLKRLAKKLEGVPYFATGFEDDFNCVVYSDKHSRYSVNQLAMLQGTKIKMYHCNNFEEFKAYVEAHQLGADLSKLWRR